MEFINVSQRKLDLRREMPWLASKVGISGLLRGWGLTGLCLVRTFTPKAKATRVGVWYGKNLWDCLMISSSRASLAKMAEIHLGFLLIKREWNPARVTYHQPGSDTIRCGAPPEYHCSQTVTAHASPGKSLWHALLQQVSWTQAFLLMDI